MNLAIVFVARTLIATAASAPPLEAALPGRAQATQAVVGALPTVMFCRAEGKPPNELVELHYATGDKRDA